MKKKKEFKPSNKNLDLLFTNDNINTKYKFFIPNFQRQYSWNNKNLEELWKDLVDAYNKNDNCYFLGSIVLIEEENKDYITYHLIDGQQRFTTLVIMINVLVKDYKEKLKLKRYKRLNKYIKPFGKEGNFVLQSNPNYDSLFKEQIRDAETFNHTEKELIKEKDLKKDDPSYKYKNTAYFFYDKFKNIDNYLKEDGNLNDFVNYIFNNVKIIKTICYDENFAIKMFISLNDRGLPLSNADNFKSWLYSNCQLDDRDTFNDDWKTLVTSANDLEVSMDEFIIFYEYYLLKSNPKQTVVDELKIQLDGQDTMKTIIELKKFMSCLKKVKEPKENTSIIYSLLYVDWSRYVITQMTSAYMVNYPEITKLFTLLRKFHYIALISGDNVNAVKQTSFRLIEYIVDKRSIYDIEDLINDYIYRKDRIEKVYNNINGDVYNTSFIKQLMLSIDYDLLEDDDKKFQPIDSSIHLDHILPHAYQTNKEHEWDYITNHEEISEVIDSFGNLALLQWYKNIKAINKGLQKKLNLYKGFDELGKKRLEGKKGKGVTKFETSQELIKEYAGTNKKWDLNSIKRRKKSMIKRTEELLNINEKDKGINYEEIDKKYKQNGNWLYNNKKLNNKQLIRELLINYITNNNIKRFNKIPETLINYKVNKYNFITEKDNGEPRYLIKIDKLELYVCSIYYKNDIEKLINLFKELFDFEYEYIENNNLSLQKSLVKQVIDELNKTYNEEFISKNPNSKPTKYIQFYKKDWEEEKIYLELYCKTASWNENINEAKLELHFEKSISNQYLEYLKDFNIELNTEETPYAHIGVIDGELMSNKITLNFTNEEESNNTIKEIIYNLKTYIDKYDKLITEVIEDVDD